MFHLHPILLDDQKYPQKKHSTGLLTFSSFPISLSNPYAFPPFYFSLTVGTDFE